MAQIDAFFKMVHELGASDLHLSSGSQPVVRLHGELQRVKYKVLEHEELKKMLYEITPEPKIKAFEETGDVDFSYEVPQMARYRVNYYMQARGVAAAFREIPQEILTVEQLGLPSVLKGLSLLPKGLVLVTGPTGSGKSTTLAAMMDYVNRNRKDHILTIEDPIEFVHDPVNCLINQREVGRDTQDFTAALRGALREDPDVILLSEQLERSDSWRAANEAWATSSATLVKTRLTATGWRLGPVLTADARACLNCVYTRVDANKAGGQLFDETDTGTPPYMRAYTDTVTELLFRALLAQLPRYLDDQFVVYDHYGGHRETPRVFASPHCEVCDSASSRQERF